MNDRTRGRCAGLATLAAATLVLVGAACGDDDDVGPASTTSVPVSPASTDSTAPVSTAPVSTAPVSTAPADGAAPGAAPFTPDPAWETFDEAWFVWGVAPDDVLNVRDAPGPGNPIVDTLAPDATGIRLYDVAENVRGEIWRPIAVDGGAGWVNARYLRPVGPASPAVVGAPDPQVVAASDAVVAALVAGDHRALAALVDPSDGVTVTPYAFVGPDAVTVTADQVAAAGTDGTEYLWGYTDGEGEPIEQTIAERLAEVAGSTALTSTDEIGYDVRLGGGNSIDNLAERFPAASVVEHHFDGTSRYGDFDWTSVRLVFEPTADGPRLVAIVQDGWTI